MSTDKTRDHRTEHPGCNAMFPWDRGCKRWSNVELMEHARSQTEDFSREEGEAWLVHMMRFPGEYRLRSGHRNAYIAAVEGWRQEDFEARRGAAMIFGHTLGWTEDEVAEETAAQWKLHLQQLALTVLYVYKA